MRSLILLLLAVLAFTVACDQLPVVEVPTYDLYTCDYARSARIAAVRTGDNIYSTSLYDLFWGTTDTQITVAATCYDSYMFQQSLANGTVCYSYEVYTLCGSSSVHHVDYLFDY